VASRKQKAAARRNIKKAHAARRKKSKTRRKSSSRRKSSKSNKRRRSNPGTAKKAPRRQRVMSKSDKFIKGFLGGAGSAQLAGDGVALVSNSPTVQTITKFAAGAAGGYYVGKKSVIGLVGGVVAEGVDLALNLARGGGGVGVSRFSRL